MNMRRWSVVLSVLYLCLTWVLLYANHNPKVMYFNAVIYGFGYFMLGKMHSRQAIMDELIEVRRMWSDASEALTTSQEHLTRARESARTVTFHF